VVWVVDTVVVPSQLLSRGKNYYFPNFSIDLICSII